MPKILPSKFKIDHFLARLRKSSFIKNVIVVMSGTAVAQVIGFCLTPIISRLFSPEDFGIFGSFNSIATIVTAGSTLQYNNAIMLPKDKKDAFILFFVSCLCTITVGFLTLIFCLVAPAFVNGVMKTDGIWALALLVVITIVFGLNQSCQAWNTRAKAFNHISASQVIRGLSSNGMQIGFGYFKVGATGLIVSNVLADLLASLNLAKILLPDLLTFLRSIQWKEIKKLAKEYRDFPLYAASQNIVWALSVGMPVLLLTHYYGIIVAGAYAFGLRVIQTPMGLLTGALRQVLFQKAAEVQHQSDSLLPLFFKITLMLFILAIFPSIILVIWAPKIFLMIFGSQWHMAGEFAQSIVLWMTFLFCNVPAVLFSQLIRIQHTMFICELLLLAVGTLTLIVGGLYLSASQTIMLFSMLGAAKNIILIFIVGSAIKKKEKYARLDILTVS